MDLVAPTLFPCITRRRAKIVFTGRTLALEGGAGVFPITALAVVLGARGAERTPRAKVVPHTTKGTRSLILTLDGAIRTTILMTPSLLAPRQSEDLLCPLALRLLPSITTLALLLLSKGTRLLI